MLLQLFSTELASAITGRSFLSKKKQKDANGAFKFAATSPLLISHPINGGAATLPKMLEQALLNALDFAGFAGKS